MRKAKSMEVLSRKRDKREEDDEAHYDEHATRKRKDQTKKDLLKEKSKFSAFLNEITRQVLSPSRLTSLGVPNAHRSPSPGRTSKSPRDTNIIMEATRQMDRALDQKRLLTHRNTTTPAPQRPTAAIRPATLPHLHLVTITTMDTIPLPPPITITITITSTAIRATTAQCLTLPLILIWNLPCTTITRRTIISHTTSTRTTLRGINTTIITQSLTNTTWRLKTTTPIQVTTPTTTPIQMITITTTSITTDMNTLTPPQVIITTMSITMDLNTMAPTQVILTIQNLNTLTPPQVITIITTMSITMDLNTMAPTQVILTIQNLNTTTPIQVITIITTTITQNLNITTPITMDLNTMAPTQVITMVTTTIPPIQVTTIFTTITLDLNTITPIQVITMVTMSITMDLNTMAPTQVILTIQNLSITPIQVITIITTTTTQNLSITPIQVITIITTTMDLNTTILTPVVLIIQSLNTIQVTITTTTITQIQGITPIQVIITTMTITMDLNTITPDQVISIKQNLNTLTPPQVIIMVITTIPPPQMITITTTSITTDMNTLTPPQVIITTMSITMDLNTMAPTQVILTIQNLNTITPIQVITIITTTITQNLNITTPITMDLNTMAPTQVITMVTTTIPPIQVTTIFTTITLDLNTITPIQVITMVTMSITMDMNTTTPIPVITTITTIHILTLNITTDLTTIITTDLTTITPTQIHSTITTMKGTIIAHTDTHQNTTPQAIGHHHQPTPTYVGPPPAYRDSGSEVEKIRALQEQNEDLQHTLLQTTVRMECMGAEFKTSHQVLESELQRTRIELSSLMDRFKSLHSSYSYSQDNNHLLEKQLHCVAGNVDVERDQMNQRITELTEQLAVAKTTIHSLEAINVTPMLQGAMEKQLQSDEAANQIMPPAAPPPVQFMDHSRYDKAGDDQPLGPVPEEEESDWSEMGDEERHCVPIGHREGTAILTWISSHPGRWMEGDTESESGGEETVRQYPPRPLQIPHLQFTVHPETLPIPMDDVSPTSFQTSHGDPEDNDHHSPPSRKFGSPIRILSASMEKISDAGLTLHELQGHMKGSEAVMDLHGGAAEYVEEEAKIVLSWRDGHRHGMVGGGGGGAGGGGVGAARQSTLQEAERLLHHYISQTPSGVAEEVLNGERTKL
ncbi:hypothetical protein AALO_G00022610 [Alosa alosa]|uniref:Uncharacterized protein n=1 Tax=Alosa alosa TaxID=278164 RepID=A0AAV6HEW2_9TELE|nr:hypothetical protein AALO_G00022610 [Alosa alosa]